MTREVLMAGSPDDGRPYIFSFCDSCLRVSGVTLFHQLRVFAGVPAGRQQQQLIHVMPASRSASQLVIRDAAARSFPHSFVLIRGSGFWANNSLSLSPAGLALTPDSFPLLLLIDDGTEDRSRFHAEPRLTRPCTPSTGRSVCPAASCLQIA